MANDRSEGGSEWLSEEASFGSFSADGDFKPYETNEEKRNRKQREEEALQQQELQEAAERDAERAMAEKAKARERAAQRAAEREEAKQRPAQQPVDTGSATAAAQRQLRALLADRSVSLTRVETWATEVYRATRRCAAADPEADSGEIFYAKRCSPDDGKRLASLLQLLRARGVAAPELVAPRAEWWRRGWLLQEDASGERLSDCRAFLSHGELLGFYENFGRTVGAMHSITEADAAAAALEAATAGRSWMSVHMDWVRERLAVLEGTPEFGSIVEECEAWFVNSHTSLFQKDEVTFRLLHLDLNQSNVFVAPDDQTGHPRVSAIIDWDEVSFGHTEEELMRTECAHFSFDGSESDDSLRTAFFAGYISVLPLDEGYETRRPFYYLSRLLVHCGCMIELDGYGIEADATRGLAEIERVLAGDPELDYRGNALL